MVCVCDKVPHLPRKWQLDVSKCHTCHANGSWMSPSARPATQMAGGCRRVPHLPRKVARRHRATNFQPHHQTLPSVSSVTPATQMAIGCLQAPCPHKWQVDVAECQGCHAKCRDVTARPIRSKRATTPCPASPVPHLPRKWQLDVSKCHACHANGRWMSPATQSATASPRPVRSKRATRPSPVP